MHLAEKILLLQPIKCGGDYPYVFPVLEGDRLVGRLDAKAYKAEGVLRVKAFWPEAGVKMTKARNDKLDAEMSRLARFAGCDRVEYLPGWQREFLAQSDANPA